MSFRAGFNTLRGTLKSTHGFKRGYNTLPPPPTPPPRTGRSALRKWTTRLGTLPLTPSCAFTYILGSAFPPQIVLLLYPRYAPPPPDKDSIRGKAITSDVEEDLQKLLIVEKLRGREGWYETSELRLGDLCNTG
jgi:hypothetical protein